MSDFNSQINDLIEYKKLVVKLEEALKLKEDENQKILKINSELKELNNEMRIVMNNQNQKIIQQYSEIKNISKNYENQINTLNISHENEKQKYDEKIFELSAYNPHNHEIKIKKDIEEKYKLIIKNKDLEISNLSEELNELKDNLTLKEKELNILKINFNEQLYTERDTHSYQMKDLLTKISNQNNLEKADEEKEILKEFKLSIKQNEEKIEILQKELENERKEKAQNEIKYNKELFDLDTKLKEEIDKNQILNDDINNFKEIFEKIKISISDNEFEMNKIDEENKKLMENKESLIIDIKEKENLIQDKIEELNNIKKNYKKILNENKIQKEENKNLQKKISDLEEKLNKEQKFENENTLLNSAENVKLYKEAYDETREKYRELIQEQKKMQSEIERKNEEIKNLNNYLEKIKKTSVKEKYGNEYFVSKYREVNTKKNYYKQQCKNANIYINKIFNILTNEQKQNLENNGIIFSKLNNINDYNGEN